MRKLHLTLFVLLLQSSLTHLLSQTNEGKALSGYIKNINQFNLLNPQEKVYLHFDNTGYFLGDTIWFKGYVVSATEHRPDAISKVLHVELLSPQGEVLDTRKLKVEEGGCHGEFALSKESNSGFYEVRAYSRSMLNFGEDCIFSRVFPIYDDPEWEGDYAEPTMDEEWNEESEREESKQKREVNLYFYPEGGNAVVGLPSRIAFKAVDKQGEDLKISGMVHNQRGEAVTILSTLHQGMGLFELTPESTQYTVEVEHQDKKHRFPLTGIIPSGYSLQVNQPDEESFLVNLQKSPTLPFDTLAVSISCRGRVYDVEAVALGDEPYSFQLEKEKLPAGCLQFTLFDAEGRIHAERYAFNSLPVKYYTIELLNQPNKLKPFEKLDLNFRVKDKEGKPVTTTFSLAVRDVESEPRTLYKDDILTYLLLSSEVKGYIENPQQYFGTTNRATRTKLDILMMVQAWRRYNWQQMAGITPFEVKHYAEEGLGIHGKVLWFTLDKTQPEVDVIYWMSRGKETLHGKTKSDKEGNYFFAFPENMRPGRWQLNLSTSDKGKQLHSRILIDRWVSLPQRAYSPYELKADNPLKLEEAKDSIKRGSINEMQYLDVVEVTEKRTRRQKAKPTYVLDIEKDITRLIDQGLSYHYTLGEYLENRIPSIRYHIELSIPKYRYGSRPLMLYGGGFNSRTEDYAKIEVFRSMLDAFFLYPYLAKTMPSDKFIETPAIAYAHRYREKRRDGTYKKGIRHTYYQTYSQVKEFYHVDNSKKLLGDLDFRRTLYWNPNVKTDSQGKAQVSFYNNSSCRQISISAEGLHSNGTAIVMKE